MFTMFHVRLKWLTWFQVVSAAFALITLLLFLLRSSVEMLAPLANFWGVNPSVAVLSGLVIVYTMTIYIALRERSIWLAHMIGLFLTVILLSTMLMVEGGLNYASWIFIVWAVVEFGSGMLGPYAPISLSTLNILGLFFAYTGSLQSRNLGFGLIPIGYCAVAGGLGWLVFHKHYTQTQQESTKLERLDSMLREEQLKSEILIESIADGVVVVDKQGAIQLFNPSAAAMTGWHVDEALGIDCRSIMVFYDEQGKNITDTSNPFATVLEKAEHFTNNKIRLETRGNKKIYLSLVISPIIRHQTGEVAGAIAIFRDVSKEHEEESQRAEFISTASHEMRTPVAAIEGFLALALNPSVSTIDDKAKEYLTKAHTATQHLGQLFQDLLTISKAEDGRLENHPRVLEVGSTLKELVEQWRFTANRKSLSLRFLIGNQDVIAQDKHVVLPDFFIYVDQERIREVVTNLFDNAVKYTEKGGVVVRLEGDNDTVQISIEDTGSGIPREDIPHLFQKFYRVDNTATRQVGGTGLGLYLSRKIIELYHGHIMVDSEVGKGSRFTVSIPRLSREKAEALLAEQTGSEVTAPITPKTSEAAPTATPPPSAPVATSQPAQAASAPSVPIAERPAVVAHERPAPIKQPARETSR